MAISRRIAVPSVLAALLAAVMAVPVGALMVATAAYPHGAPANPLSRTLECGPLGGATSRSTACKAALAASGGPGSFNDWDYLHVPNVNGRDREVIPDGHLCSGGLDTFKGLDLARTDWPTTTLTAGARYTFRYTFTIPHPGSFRMFVTRDGYRPTTALRWADLEAKPFLTADNPPTDAGAYVMKGKLPAGKTGRHIIYTIWQNEGPDTYYSCSDVVFKAPAGHTSATPTPRPAGSASPTGNASPGTAGIPMAHAERPGGRLLAIGGIVAGIGVVAVAALLAFRPRRTVGRRRASRRHRS
jgi:chitin-binding protein